jgi:hypothetical protein
MPHWLTHALDGLSRACPEYCLHFWEVLGTWIAGLATLASVIVALRLARRSGVVLDVSADVRMLIETGAEPPYPEYVSIAVKNVGERDCVVEGVGWLGPPWRKVSGIQQVSEGPGFPRPPYSLRAGERVSFLIDTEIDGRPWAHQLERMLGRWPEFDARLIRVTAWTPFGVQARARVDKTIRELLVTAIRAKRATAAPGPTD